MCLFVLCCVFVVFVLCACACAVYLCLCCVPVFVHMIAWSDAGIRERYRGAEGARVQAAGLSKLANPLRLKWD